MINFLAGLTGVRVDESGQKVHGISLKRDLIIERIAEDDYEEVPEFISDELGDMPECVMCSQPIVTTSLCDWFICTDCNEHNGVLYGLKFPENAGERPGESAAESAARRRREGRAQAGNDDDESYDDVARSDDKNDGASAASNAATSSTASRRRPAAQQRDARTPKSTYFDTKLFMHYFEHRLLPALKEARLENVLIVLDLASIHLRVAGGLTLSEILSSKAKGIKYLRERGEDVNAAAMAPQIEEKVRRRFAREQTDAQRIAAAAGHRVVYLPVHHPSLSLIEYVWAIGKRKLARSYNVERRFDTLAADAMKEFTSIDKQKVLNMRKHVKEWEHYFVQLEMQVLQKEDREALEAYRKLQRRYEQRHDANGSHGDESIQPPTIPHTMPLSFRGDLNRFKEF